MIRLYIFSVLFLLFVDTRGQDMLNKDSSFYSRVHQLFNPDESLTTISLNTLKGKIVILEFWNRYCVACIQQMPKLYELQQQFKDDIVILPVTADNLEQVEAMYRRQKGGSYEMRLPSIYGDTALTRLFAIRGFPKAIWIDRQGEFLAQTLGEAVGEEMIEKVSEGDFTFLKRVATVTTDMSLLEGTADAAEERVEQDLFSLRITPYNKNLTTSHLRQKDGPLAKNKLTILNSTVIDIIKSMYSHSTDLFLRQLGDDMKNRRIRIGQHVALRYFTMDSLRNIRDFRSRTEFREQQLHCLFVRGHDSIGIEEVKALALQAVERTFGIKTSVQQHVEKCLVISAVPDRITPLDVSSILLENQVFIDTGSDLLRFLNNNFVSEPLAVFADRRWEAAPLHMIVDRTADYQGTIGRLRELGFVMGIRDHQIDILHID